MCYYQINACRVFKFVKAKFDGVFNTRFNDIFAVVDLAENAYDGFTRPIILIP